MPVYSHSRLSTFEKCPLKYRYRYIDRIKRETQGIEAFMGRRVHEVLEGLYRDLTEDRRPTLDDLLGRYRSAWSKTYSDDVRIVKKEYTADHYLRIGERCIANYVRSHEPFDRDETVGLEERVQLSLDHDGGYQIQGYIDRLVRAGPGVYEIHDYKTSGSLPSALDLRQDRQLTLYQMGVQERFPDARTIRLVWHYLVFDRAMIGSRTDAEIESHRVRAMRLIDTIEAASDYPPKESALCRWCEYRDICPVQADQYRAETGAPPARPAGRAGTAMKQMDLFP